jgi:hypothetical protein
MLRTLSGQIAGHLVHAFGEITPDAAHTLDLGLSAQFAFGADLASNTCHLGGKHAQLLDHLVDDFCAAQEFAFQRPAFDFQGHGLGQVALGHRANRPRHLGGGPNEIINQRVDRFHLVGPISRQSGYGHALSELSFLADSPADARGFRAQPLVQRHRFVEAIGDFSGNSSPIRRQANREVAVLVSQERGQQLGQQLGRFVVPFLSNSPRVRQDQVRSFRRRIVRTFHGNDGYANQSPSCVSAQQKEGCQRCLVLADPWTS